MKINKLLIFGVLVLVQLFFPAKMIWQQEHIIKHGKLYRFKTKPIDPTDPIRGKYISLNFEANEFKISNKTDWEDVYCAYAIIETDEKGFAKVKSVSKTKPTDTENFVWIRTGLFSYDDDEDTLTLRYTFDKFYMEESKAAKAEKLYQKTSEQDITYATVYIKNGKAVLGNVYVNDKPISELIKQK